MIQKANLKDLSSRGMIAASATNTMVAASEPPNSREAELGVLGCLLLSPIESIEACQSRGITDGDFYDLRHGVVFKAISVMIDDQKPIDLITVQQRLKDEGRLDGIGGIAALSNMMDSVPSAANIGYYADILKEKAVLRRMIKTCYEYQGRALNHSGEIDALLTEFEESASLVRGDLNTVSKIIDPKDAVRRMTDDLQARFNLQGKLSGVGTGLGGLDAITNGLQYGEMAIIGARPSAGKTAMACTVIEQACLRDEIPTAVVTLEMPEKAILRRLCSSWASIDAKTLRSGMLCEGDFKKIMAFNKLVSKSPLYFVDGVSGMTIGQIASDVRRLVKRHGVKLVIIDYLQKIKPASSHEKRTYEVGAVSQSVKGLADSLGVAILSLAQLNREPDKGNEKGRLPRLSDLADSSQIERDGDMIALIHRVKTKDDPQGMNAKLIVAKQRDGEVGVIDMHFTPKYCKFTTPSPIQD